MADACAHGRETQRGGVVEVEAKRVLITGIAGGQGKLLARRLQHSLEVCGADIVSWPGHPPGVRVHKVDLRKRKFEDVIRTEQPDAVVHLGFIRHFRRSDRLRHDVNVRGTKQLLDHCVRHGVKQLVVLSSGYVYGAFAENPYNMDEDFPLSASRAYPEIRDLVEVDTLASAFIWRHPEVRTCVLRPVSVIGRTVRSMIRSYLELPRVPTVMGFDPMMQLLEESDLTRAMELALEHQLQGVYNVAGSGEVPLHTIVSEVGASAWPVPGPLLNLTFDQLFRWGLWPYPPGMLDYLKYPVSLDGSRFVEATGFEPRVSLREIFETMRQERATV
jgi:UDP-glucose 4-epimerase